MAIDRELTENEIKALEALMEKNRPSVLPPSLKIMAITLEEAGLLKTENGRLTVTEEAVKLVEAAKDPFKLKRL